MSWNDICPINDILPGTGVGALVNGHQVAIFHLEDGRLFAIDNFDPHSQANVLSRGIVGDLNGKAVVASPIYKQHFCLETGECLEDASQSVAAHAVQVHEGMIQLRLSAELGVAA